MPVASQAGADRPHRRLTIHQQLLIALLSVNALVMLFIGGHYYAVQKTALYKDMDERLTAVAVMAKEMLPPDYHDRITGQDSVSEAEFQKIVDRNNRLCEKLGLEYLWSLLLVEGKIVFTTSTSPDKVAANRKHAAFFETHSNPELYTNTFATMRTTIKGNVDKWGDIRMALVPFRDAQGRNYLFGSSIRTTEVERQLREVVRQAFVVGFVGFVFSMAVCLWVARRVTRPIIRLTDTISAISTGRADLKADETGSAEMVILARHFNLMNRFLQNRISVLEASRSQLVTRHDTELRHAAGSLQTSEQRYRSLLNFAVDGILIGTKEGIVTDANECVCALFGLPREEIVGRHVTELPFAKECLEDNPFRFDLVHAGEKTVREREILHRDGTSVLVEIHTKMMADGTLQSIYHDITERKRVEQALIKSEQRYKDLLNFAVDGIMVGDNQGVIYEANECFCGICGLSQGELLGTNVHDLPFTPESMELSPLRFDRVENGETVASERTVRRRDGSEVIVEMRTKKMPDGLHQSIWHDVTRRKQEECELQETRRMLEEAQRLAKLGAWKYEVSTRKVTWTDEVYRIHGLDPDYPINQDRLRGCNSFVAPEYRQMMNQSFSLCAEKGTSCEADLELIRAYGQRIWVHASAQPVFEDGKIIRVDGHLMDITDKKRSEIELKESEKRYRQLFEMESDALLLTDFESGRFLDVNLAAETLFGYSRDELLTKGPMDILAEPEPARTILENIARSSPTVVRVDERLHKKKDGSVFPVEITASFFTMNGRLVFLSAVRDVSARKRARELLEAWNEELEKSVAERTAEVEKYAHQLKALAERLVRAEEAERQRIADVLHEDLQQILVASRMALGLAQRSAKGTTASTALDSVDDMLAQSLRLTRSLVHDIAVPAVREGEIPFAVDCLRQQFAEKFNLAVDLTVEEGVQPVSENAYLCLYRAVQELLFNVVKHAKVNRVAIDVRTVNEGGSVRIVVMDEGCGFEPATAALTEKTENGFGLFSISERLEGMGGSMEIQSEVGRGTKVTLTAPIRG